MTWSKTHARTTDPDTSHEAAESAEGFYHAHCEVIYEVLRKHNVPLATEQIAAVCDLDYLQVARRMTDLQKADLVVDSGKRWTNPRGRKAVRWCLV